MRAARRRHRVTFAALAVAVASILLGRAASVRYLFPIHEVRPGAAPPDFVPLSLRSSDGVAVHALRLEGVERAPTVVIFHNNRETASDVAPLARSLRTLGFGALLVEYRGYGASRAETPDEEGLYRDAEASLDALAAAGVPPERVVLWGHSLGTGVAAEMARRGRGAALVLMSPYTSIDELVTGVAPFLPASILVRDHFDTLSKAAAIRVPTLVIHGDADAIVPFAMGKRLATTIAGAQFLPVPGAHHSDIFAHDEGSVLRAVAALVAPLGR
jgi:fermentation-respiration switch protein FrsA (DUF1100 family)